jgi:two-component system, OmpR family, phosphate regulon sensor histidine kinase PhoR
MYPHQEKPVTMAKRLGLAGITLISLGASAAYYVTLMTMQGRGYQPGGMGYTVLGVVAALTAVVLLVFWRSVNRSIRTISSQLDNMARTQQVGLVMADGSDELAQITKPLNEFLSGTRRKLEELRSENRELQIQTRIASAEKHHTEAIIFSISDAVIVTNRFDELMLANEAAEKLLGFKLASSLRKNIDRIISDGTLVRLIRETRSHGRSFTRKVVEHSIDQTGSPKTFSITLSCVVTPNEEVSGVVAVLHDVTREKEIARMKTDFVSNVSHELKTPLASIKAYIEMLVDGEAPDDKTRNEFYEIIQAETERMHRLIENILNISRIESGVVKVVKEPMSLTGVAKQVLDVTAPQAKAKNIKVVDRLAPVYYQVEADQDMVYQAVMNLVSNAIKYTPEGGTITVGVSVDDRQQMAVCEVSDTGAGIPPDDLPRIFDKFYRVQANNKMAKGTGLGLTLVKHIIETVHEGKLSVTSEVGKGSTFSFELPILQ